MKQPPHHLVDDVLSAHADGALTGAEAAGAAEHLAACADCAERLAQLEAARAAVRAPVAPVDDLTRQRLVRRALEVERQHARLVPRSPRWLAAAAAAAVALGTVSFLAVRDGGGDQLASQAESAGIGGLPLSEEFIATNAGAFDDPESLRVTLEDAEDPDQAVPPAFGSGSSGAASGGGTAGGGGIAASPPSTTASDSDSANSSDQPVLEQSPPLAVSDGVEAPDVVVRESQSAGPGQPSDAYAAIARCYSSLTDQLPRDGRLVAAATGTYQGRPAIAMGFRTADGRRLLAMILSRDECSIITAQSYR